MSHSDCFRDRKDSDRGDTPQQAAKGAKQAVEVLRALSRLRPLVVNLPQVVAQAALA